MHDARPAAAAAAAAAAVAAAAAAAAAVAAAAAAAAATAAVCGSVVLIVYTAVYLQLLPNFGNYGKNALPIFRMRLHEVDRYQ